jgi:hypothetical protein
VHTNIKYQFEDTKKVIEILNSNVCQDKVKYKKDYRTIYMTSTFNTTTLTEDYIRNNLETFFKIRIVKGK